MKKITSILLALIMMLSMVTISITSTSAAPAEETVEVNGVTYIYAHGIDNIKTDREIIRFHRDTPDGEIITTDEMLNLGFLLSSFYYDASYETVHENRYVGNDYMFGDVTIDGSDLVEVLVYYMNRTPYISLKTCSVKSYEIPTDDVKDGDFSFSSDYVDNNGNFDINKVTLADDWGFVEDHIITVWDFGVEYNNISYYSDDTANSVVTLDYETANLRVTVPTVLPVSVDSDNNVTVAENAQIVNHSNGQVDITNAVLSGSNSWTLAPFTTDFTKVPVDTKQYGFKLQDYNVPVSGNAFNSQFATIDGDDALDITYDANVAIQSEAVDAAEIGNIVFTVAWHK